MIFALEKIICNAPCPDLMWLLLMKMPANFQVLNSIRLFLEVAKTPWSFHKFNSKSITYIFIR